MLSARVRSAANTHVAVSAVQRVRPDRMMIHPFSRCTVLHHVWRCPAQKSRLVTGWMVHSHIFIVATEHVKTGVRVLRYHR